MTTGTGDKKKVVILAVLGVAAAYLVYANLIASPDTGPQPARRPAAAARTEPLIPPADDAAARSQTGSRPPIPGRSGARGRNEEFHPVLHSRRPEDHFDPTKVDPTLRLDLLAKLQSQEPAGGARNLFMFGTAPPPKAELPKGPEPKVVPRVAIGPRQPQPAASKEPPKDPPPPPITLKYYGYSNTRNDGRKTAFFLDGDDILVASEGDTVKRRYRVVRIGVTSVVMEDVESKRQQPLPLAEEAGG